MCCVVTVFILYRILNRTSRSAALPYPEHGCWRMPAPLRSPCSARYYVTWSDSRGVLVVPGIMVRGLILQRLALRSIHCPWHFTQSICVCKKNTYLFLACRSPAADGFSRAFGCGARKAPTTGTLQHYDACLDPGRAPWRCSEHPTSLSCFFSK